MVNRIGSQVRLMDSPNTVMGLLGVDEWDGVESSNLMEHANGLQDRDFSGFLMGRMDPSGGGGSLFGYRVAQRQGNTGDMLKFLWYSEQDETMLFDLTADPGESSDISDTQSAAIAAMQNQVRKELGTAAPEGQVADQAELNALKVLGYLE